MTKYIPIENCKECPFFTTRLSHGVNYAVCLNSQRYKALVEKDVLDIMFKTCTLPKLVVDV